MLSQLERRAKTEKNYGMQKNVEYKSYQNAFILPFCGALIIFFAVAAN